MRHTVPVRLVQLFVGLALYGFTMAMLVEAGLGLDPWDVFHEGVAEQVPLTFGQVVIATGAVLLLLWIPLRQRPGVGTVANVVVIGLAADAGIAVIERPDDLVWQVLLLTGGVVGNGVAGALYIGADLGPGPRDGLWLGLVRLTGRSVRFWRTVLEVTVLGVGFLLGGTVGFGTVLYALAIGPIVQAVLPRVQVRRRHEPKHPGGGHQVDPALAAETIGASHSLLTAREADVLELALDGSSVDEIARRAHLTVGTTRDHLSSAMAKLGVVNRYEAALKARDMGWI